MIKPIYFVGSLLGSALMISCGGGGVSDDFTREINDVHIAWKNTTGAIDASRDSVENAYRNWATMMLEMKVPDSLQSRLTPAYKAKLDSVYNVCEKQHASFDALKVELENSRLEWEKETRVFADWKDRVFKSEIDVETARKDLKHYQEEVKTNTDISNRVNERLSQIRQHCLSNCMVYDSLLSNIPREDQAQRRRGRRGG